MTKKNMKNALACAVLLGLTACGGSGGGSPSVTSPSKPQAPKTENTKGETPKAESSQTPNEAITDKKTDISQSDTIKKPETSKIGTTKKPETSPTDTAKKPETPKMDAVQKPETPAAQTIEASVLMAKGMPSDDLTFKLETAAVKGDRHSEISVNGHKINIATPSRIDADGVMRPLNQRELTFVSGNQLSHMRFVWQYVLPEKTHDDVHYVVAIGDVTPTVGADAVPTTGKATYVGSSVFNAFGGTSAFDVNFGNKTIKGQAVANGYTVPLSGKISGASFGGTQNNVTMQGHFFGPKAAELGGTFHGKIVGDNEKGLSLPVLGVFGATKQK